MNANSFSFRLGQRFSPHGKQKARSITTAGLVYVLSLLTAVVYPGALGKWLPPSAGKAAARIVRFIGPGS
jgi:hypothetical protein